MLQLAQAKQSPSSGDSSTNIRIEECVLPMIGGLLGSYLIIPPVKCHIVAATMIISECSGSSRDKECNISESMMSILAIVVTKMQHKSRQCDEKGIVVSLCNMDNKH
jgi:hypothetical protein